MNYGTLSEEMSLVYSKISFTDMPRNVVLKTRRTLFDFITVSLLGNKLGRLLPLVEDYFLSAGGAPQATMLGTAKKLPAGQASFLMGVASHSVELDDGHRFGTSHPAVAVIPAVLALAEKENCPFEEIVLAVAIGYDGMLRIARAINPSHLKRGFHSTGTCGTIGSALGCSKLLGFNEQKTAHAVSIAALQSSGLQEMLHDQPFIKPLQAGRAASAGLLAAELVRLGAGGPRTIFEGKHGWLKAMSDSVDIDAILDHIGQKWEIMNTYTKLYPTCRHCHTAIDLAIDLRSRLERRALNSIEAIEVKTYDVAVSEVADIIMPSTIDEAMFSLPFSIALVLKYGNVMIDYYNDHYFNDHDIRQIAEKVYITTESGFNSAYPHKRGAELEIKMADGTVHRGTLDLPRGEPETALSDQELFTKGAGILEKHYDINLVKELWQVVVDAEMDQVDYRAIVEICAGRS